MTHPASVLNAALISAWSADLQLAALLGPSGISDRPARGAQPPYVVVARHEVRPRDTDVSPGWEHRVRLHAWAHDPNTAEALSIAERLILVAESVTLNGPELWLTHVAHQSTQSGIDPKSGRGRAIIEWRFMTEPQA